MILFTLRPPPVATSRKAHSAWPMNRSKPCMNTFTAITQGSLLTPEAYAKIHKSGQVEVEGHARVYAIADEDLARENDEIPLWGTLCASSSRRRCGKPCARALRSSWAVTMPITRRTCRSHPKPLPAWPAICPGSARWHCGVRAVQPAAKRCWCNLRQLSAL